MSVIQTMIMLLTTTLLSEYTLVSAINLTVSILNACLQVRTMSQYQSNELIDIQHMNTICTFVVWQSQAVIMGIIICRLIAKGIFKSQFTLMYVHILLIIGYSTQLAKANFMAQSFVKILELGLPYKQNYWRTLCLVVCSKNAVGGILNWRF